LAQAVPSFARQTGLECGNCHLSWLELSSVGREFKLGGYTLMKEVKEERPWLPMQSDGPPPKLPLAAMLQLSATNTNSTAGADPSNFPRNNSVALQQFSLFYAGRIAEHVGAFAQWTYDGIAHHSSIDNVDIRYANHFKREGTDLTYGLTVNNNPTVSDIYSTTPAWGFPLRFLERGGGSERGGVARWRSRAAGRGIRCLLTQVSVRKGQLHIGT